MKSLNEFISHGKRNVPSSTISALDAYFVMPDAPKKSWAEADGMFWGTPQSHDILPSNLYRMNVIPNIGPVFIKQQNDTDDLIILPDSESFKVVEEIRAFKDLRPSFQEYGFLFKRGILLWGPPGSGKTCTLQVIVKMLMEEANSVVVLIDDPGCAATCLQSLRRIEPDRQIVGIMEDMDALCDRFPESSYLSLLDGESQVDNIIYLATTNYPEKLDKRFIDRPSRFDTIREISMPTAAAREVYLRAKIPNLTDLQAHEYVKASHGLSIAHMREFIILTRCFGMSIEAAAERLQRAHTNLPNSERSSDRQRLGFG